MRKDLGSVEERNKQLSESREHVCGLSSDQKHIDNLETLVVRLARQLDKQSGSDSKIAEQAMGYMHRQARGAQSILRKSRQDFPVQSEESEK